MSEDGQRVYFSAGGAMYVREQSSTTRLVSASERTGDDPAVARQGILEAADADDGSRALFTSPDRLTDDATATGSVCLPDAPVGDCGTDLYLWDGDAPAGERLTDLTTADPDGGGVLGLVAAADDLSRVYFVGVGALAEGAVGGEPNLYTWTPEDGVRLVATLAEEDAPVWGFEFDVPPRQFRDARVTADGSRLLLASRARLTAADNGGHKQIYLYDAASERLTCVSCRPDGVVSAGPAWLLYPAGLTKTARAPYRLPRNLSQGGDRVFFETEQGLVNADANGRADVYMWSAGQISLISPGRSGPSEFLGASASGDDVFFTTRERLVGSDTDDQVDLYDARVGGGFPEQQKPLPCAGDECQGSLAPRPVLPAPSGAPEAGNPPIVKRASFTVARLSATSRRALARGRKAALVVRVNKSGRVSVRGTARVGKKTKPVLSAARRAHGAGRVRLVMRLSASGRRHLTTTGQMKLRLRVRFSGASEQKVMTLALVRASSQGRNR